MWATQTCTAIGPAVMPSVAAVRRVVWEYAALAPWSRLLNRVDHATGRLTKVAPGELEAFINELVVEFDDSPDAVGDPSVDNGQLLAVTTRFASAGVGDLPFRMRLGKRYCLWEFPHVLGDATISGPPWGVLLECALQGRPPSELAVSYDTFVLTRALAKTFGRQPARVRDLVAGSSLLGRGGDEVAEPSPRRRAGLAPIDPSTLSADEREALGRPGPARERTVSGAVDRLVGRTGPGVLDVLRAWRREHAPTASVNSILFAASAAAFEQEGLPRADNGIKVLVDLRRYLPKDMRAGGNFLISYHLHPADPTSPEEIAAALRGATEAGKPLAAYAYTLVQRAVPRRAPVPAPGTRSEPAYVPSFSAAGAIVDMKGLDWLAPPERRVHGGAKSGGQPEGVSFGYTEIGGVLHVQVDFDPDRLLPGLVRRAVTRLCADPVAVLEESRATATALS